MNKLTIRDVNFAGKRVLVRVDFNVPLENGQVTDDTRIRSSIPTLEYIAQQKPTSITLMSHLGRPDGQRNPTMSLQPVANRLAELMNTQVIFVDDCIGEQAEAAVQSVTDGGIILLENTRYYKGDEKNDPQLSEALAKHGDVFVNDAFGTAHRAHASNVGVAKYLPAYAGFLMEKEIDYLSKAIESPARPFVGIMGGAKVSDKVKVIENLLDKVDMLLVGGGIANTFNAARGYIMANSLVDSDALDLVRGLIEKHGDKIVIPDDSVIGDAFSEKANTQIVDLVNGIPSGWESFDIGPKTIEQYQAILSSAKTVIWNGPLGVFEISIYANGTNAIAQTLADITDLGVKTIIGGGDSAAAIEKAGLAERVSHVSTGGGASLELLEGKALPGLVALTDS
ncbi:MAG: phosphoglycerate kinase [Phototrophicaceae bacterium]